jgi:hypothetical protein
VQLFSRPQSGEPDNDVDIRLQPRELDEVPRQIDTSATGAAGSPIASTFNGSWYAERR